MVVSDEKIIEMQDHRRAILTEIAAKKRSKTKLIRHFKESRAALRKLNKNKTD